ncbi:YihY/virulence factor BrkB family protein [Leuconostoc palmae]|uniref:YihY/virulence factor BrkB family protein n=1 Tax=Leuconostoc palmae TaxID=501487 RepID=UPI001C7CA58E|nr:YihY/virulence factor BrkB family protein [Leuconostoc palmae]
MLNRLKQFIKVISERYDLKTLGMLFSRAQINYVGPTFAYYSLLTIFPTIMSIVMIISMTSLDQAAIINVARDNLPHDIEKILMPILQSVLSKKQLSILSFSVPFTLWTVSRVIAVFRQSFNRIADAEERISNLLTRVWSFLWLLIIIAMFGVLMIASNVLSLVINQLPAGPWTGFITSQSRWVIWIAMFLALIMLNYFLPTKAAQTPLKLVAIGSFVELLMLNALNVGFTFYAKLGLKQYDFYQSIGSIIVLLIWLNLIATVLVSGYVLIQWLTILNNGSKKIKGENDGF